MSTTDPISSAAAAAAASAATGATRASASKDKNQLGQDAFLQLMVAQLKNQDPLNPTDATQFVAQLAQFSQLEQLIAIRSELESAGNTTTPAADTQTQNNSVSS